MKITKEMGRACASYDYDDFADPMLVIAALREIGASDEEIMGSKYNRKVDELALAMCAAIAGVKP